MSEFGDRNAVINAVARLAAGGDVAAVETAPTYEALDLTSDALARALRSLGVGKGDRAVAGGLGNCAEFG